MRSNFIVALAITLLSIPATQANRMEGSITLEDGRSLVRINVGNENQDHRMMRRLVRLEQAVRDLQDTVYELQNNQSREARFNCSATTCRKSRSIHSTNGSNCSFFNMYRDETIKVWATGGAEAEKSARARLTADSDVAKIQGTITCDYE